MLPTNRIYCCCVSREVRSHLGHQPGDYCQWDPWLRFHGPTVDGSDIPKNHRLDVENLANNVINYLSLNWWVKTGFLNHQQYVLACPPLPVTVTTRHSYLSRSGWNKPTRHLENHTPRSSAGIIEAAVRVEKVQRGLKAAREDGWCLIV